MENNNFNITTLEFEMAQLPQFEEVVTNRDWVLWGDDNLWPEHSIELYNYSSILRASLNSIRDAVIGQDMLINGQSANLIFANSMESVYDVYKKVVLDVVIHNGFTLNTILRRDKEGIAEFYHTDISKVRSGKTEFQDKVSRYYYSSDWTNIRKYKPVELPSFDLNAEDGSQIYYYKDYQPSQFYYPVNAWIGGRMAAEISVEIMNYHLKNLRNGYHSGAVFSMNNGIPSNEERESIYRHLQQRYTSTNNAGQIIVTFSESKDHEPTITPFSNNATSDMFIQLNELVQQSILTSCRISNPTLLGIKVVQGLGSKDEMTDAYEHFLATNIKPIQEKIIREFEKILFFKMKSVQKIEIIQNQLFEDINEPQGDDLQVL